MLGRGEGNNHDEENEGEILRNATIGDKKIVKKKKKLATKKEKKGSEKKMLGGGGLLGKERLGGNTTE